MSNPHTHKFVTGAVAAAVSVTVIYACATPLKPEDVKLKATNYQASAQTLSARVGSTLTSNSTPPIPQVTVLDQTNQPLPDVPVTFTASKPPQPTPGTVNTDLNGIARPTSWTLPTATGSVTLTAAITALGSTSFTVTLTPGPAANAAVANPSSNNQTATVGSNVAVPPQVKVTDQYGNAVPNVAVTFAVTGGGGTVVPTTPVNTDTGGVAKATSWTLGTTAGTNTLNATVAGVATPVTFTATGVAGAAANIVIAPGSPSSQGQTATAGSTVPVAPAVLVRDANNNPVPNVVARFTVATGGGKVLSSATDATGSTTLDATTNASGIATIYGWKLGTVAGSNTLSVTIPSVATVAAFTITATGTAGPPASIAVVAETPSSNNQGAFVGTAVAVPPGAVVKDANGNGVPGVLVNFAVGTNSGTIKATSTSTAGTTGSVSTDSNGVARIATWTLSATPGPDTLTATVASNTSLTVTFLATGVVRRNAASVQLSAGDGQTATVATAVTTAPAVKVTDASGAPAFGVTVLFAVTSGGQVTRGFATTDVNGIAQVGSWILGTVAGDQTLTATVVDSAANRVTLTGSTSGTASLTPTKIAGNPVVFVATGTAGPAAKLAIDSYSATVRNRLLFPAKPFVEVTDKYGNHVSQSGVNITASVDGTGATLQGTLTVATDVNGDAQFSNLSLVGSIGARNLIFSAPSLQSASAPIQLNGGLPSKVAVNGGDAQSAVQLTQLPTSPSVKVTDVDNNPVLGVPVIFAVTGGRGQTSPTNVTTDSTGVASTTWTLGAPPILNALTVTVVGDSSGISFTGSTAGTLTAQNIAGNPVVFTATATDRSTCTPNALTIGNPVNGGLSRATSCLRSVTSGAYVQSDVYSVTTTGAQTNFSATMTSSAVAPRIASLMWPPSGTSYYFDGASPLTLYYFVKAGTYTLLATSSNAANEGTYTLSSQLNPAIPAGCLYGIVTTGITVTHSLDTNCNYTLNNGLLGSSKRYIVYIPANATLSVTMTSSAFTPYVEIYSISGTTRTYVTGGGGGASVTPTSGTLYEIRATNTGGVAASGAFTLTLAP